jgi:penicillin-binding protein activator
MRLFKVALLLSTTLLLAGCAGPSKVVSRISPDSVTDLSGRWNDTDSRLVSEEMINDCFRQSWAMDHVEKYGKKPAVIVGVIQNKSSEHIAVGTFVGDIERALINSGKVQVVANPQEREQIRDERSDQQNNASEETAKRWGIEKGADYMMGGVINTITDEEKGSTVTYYQVDLNLIHLEDNSKVWLGQKKIKKFIGRRKVNL